MNTFQGIVVIDEAYVDFSIEPSFLGELDKFPNLIVLQTMSKAWGAAGIRLGMAFASPEIIAILNKIKYPYNVNLLTQERALYILENKEQMEKQLRSILSERIRLQAALPELNCVRKIYPTDANFILVEVTNADTIYKNLVRQGIIVRNRTNVTMCNGWFGYGFLSGRHFLAGTRQDVEDLGRRGDPFRRYPDRPFFSGRKLSEPETPYRYVRPLSVRRI